MFSFYLLKNVMSILGRKVYLHIIFIFKVNSCWSIVDLQCCINFRCRTQWLSYIYTYTHIYGYALYIIHFFRFFSHEAITKYWVRSLCHTVGPCWPCIFYIVMCVMLIPTPLFILPQPLAPLVIISLFSMSVDLFLLYT